MWSVLVWLLWALAILVGFLLAREAISYWKMGRYSKQGFTKLYYPFLGEFKPILDGQKHANEFEGYNTLATHNKGKPGMVINCSSGCNSWIQLLDIDLIREFLSIDNDVAVRVPHLDIKTTLGFLMTSGENALRQRSAFSGIFRQENLERIAPQIYSAVRQHFESAEIGKDDQEKLAVGKYHNSIQFVEGLMKLFSKNLIYHDSVPVPISKAGLFPAEELIAIVDLAISPRAGTNLINFLLAGVPHEQNWLEGSREVHRRGTELEHMIQRFITEREAAIRTTGAKNYDQSQFNIIDAMILHNLECESTGKSEDELNLYDMVGNCNMFTFASFDTTLTTTNSLLMHLGQSPELQTRLIKDLQAAGLLNGIHSLDQIDSCITLNEVVYEALRVYPPGPISFDRVIIKDFKLGKYQFYKGDTLNLSFAPNMWDSTFFPSGRSFSIENRNTQNKKYFLPFSTGKRACVGQLLAELELKQLLIYLLPRYQIVSLCKPEEVKYYLSLAMKLDNCYVKLVPRK